jgi:transposase
MDSELWANIRRLHLSEHLSKSAVARELNIHRDTVRRALAAHDGPPKNGFSRPTVASKLDAFKPHLADRIAQFPDIPGTTLFREIRAQGYAGSMSILVARFSPRSPESELEPKSPAVWTLTPTTRPCGLLGAAWG